MKFSLSQTIEESFFYDSVELVAIQKKAEWVSFNIDDDLENVFEKIFKFSIDEKNRIRLSSGIIAFNEKSENDLNFVPSFSYGPESYSLSEQNFILRLPNPVTQGMEKYNNIRETCLKEIQKRMTNALVEADNLVDEFIKSENEDGVNIESPTKSFRPR